MNDAKAELLEFASAECVRIELTRIGNIVNCWQLRREPLRHYAHRVALSIQEEICAREREIACRTQLLEIVLSLSKATPGKEHS